MEVTAASKAATIFWCPGSSPGNAIMKLPFGYQLGIQWIPKSAYDAYEKVPWKNWIYSSAHDAESYFWRIFGIEICIKVK